MRASLILAQLKAENEDQKFGIEIDRKAVQTPLRQIAENAGEDGAVISGKVNDVSVPVGCQIAGMQPSGT